VAEYGGIGVADPQAAGTFRSAPPDARGDHHLAGGHSRGLERGPNAVCLGWQAPGATTASTTTTARWLANPSGRSSVKQDELGEGPAEAIAAPDDERSLKRRPLYHGGSKGGARHQTRLWAGDCDLWRNNSVACSTALAAMEHSINDAAGHAGKVPQNNVSGFGFVSQKLNFSRLIWRSTPGISCTL
jgi:hypothetical protein